MKLHACTTRGDFAGAQKLAVLGLEQSFGRITFSKDSPVGERASFAIAAWLTQNADILQVELSKKERADITAAYHKALFEQCQWRAAERARKDAETLLGSLVNDLVGSAE